VYTDRDRKFEVGIADGVLGAGRCGRVIGYEVHIGQWWCPVLWDDAEDPKTIDENRTEQGIQA